MARLVRSSKFRNVFGTPFKKDECFDNARIALSTSGDSNVVKCNSTYISVAWETGGGKSFAVIPINSPSKLPDSYPLFNGHTAAVIDTDFSPFNENLIASASDDSQIMLWNIPDEITEAVGPSMVLSGHSRRVVFCNFNPVADNILASASNDCSIRIWDVKQGRCVFELLDHSDAIQSMAFNWTGNEIVSTCRDKFMRVFDIRSTTVAYKFKGYDSIKASRAIWAAEHDKIISTGFDRSSERQIQLWDPRKTTEPIWRRSLDRSPGVSIPFFDRETNMLYTAAKGDSTITYYELEGSTLHYLSDYKSSEPQRGVAFLPKRACRTGNNEIARAYKLHTTMIEPISFTVPRRAAGFQADIYPPTVSSELVLTAEQWLAGKSATPKLVEMEGQLGNGSSSNLLLSSSQLHQDSTPVTAAPAAAASPSAVAGMSRSTETPSNSSLTELTAQISTLEKNNQKLMGSLTEKQNQIVDLKEAVLQKEVKISELEEIIAKLSNQLMEAMDNNSGSQHMKHDSDSYHTRSETETGEESTYSQE